MRIPLYCLFWVGLLSTTYSQYLDLAKIEYTYAPGDNSNFGIKSRRILFNVPFRIKDEAYFFAGLDYSDVDIRFDEDMDSYDKSESSDFHELDLNFTYTFMMKNNWRFGAQITPSFFSNLTNGLESNDFLVSGVLVFVKDKKNDENARKPWRIIVGAAYSSTSRSLIPIPFFSYYRKFHPKWSYNIGAPVTNIQFHLNKSNRLKLYAEGDGVNARIQNGVIVNETDPANRLRVLLIMAGFRYEYKFSEHIESYLNVTRTIKSDLQLRDNKENVFFPDVSNLMHYRIGIRCKI